MKATLNVECIGDDARAQLNFSRALLTEVFNAQVAKGIIGEATANYFVAEITGFDPKYKYQRTFLRAKKDYRRANSKGSRGVYAWYILESGRVYDVLERVSWRRSERYFCKVTDQGDIIRISEYEVQQWLKSH